MRLNPLSCAVLPASLWTLVAARLHNSLVPEDPYAFPKYRVVFHNGLPVLNDTAQKWLQTGLRGGEAEFLERPPEEGVPWSVPAVQSIDGGQEQQRHDGEVESQSETPAYKLELMKMGPRTSYLCLIPPPPVENTSLPVDDPSADVTPMHTWSLLQPLSGNCLYHKQGWFTYAYCHNSHVRQFHELQKPHSQRPGEYKPEEDTEWEAYTLGRAPPTVEPGAELTVAQEQAIAANVELARSAGSQYLVQRWGDGTYCEKIGKKREIEIQFHCSMTMTDTILFVKETQTCHYVLYIATPRLCGEPGFRSRLDAREEAYVRCREVVPPEEYAVADRSLPEADEPIRMPRRAPKPVIAPPPAPSAEEKGAGGAQGDRDSAHVSHQDLLRMAIERMVNQGKLRAGDIVIEPLGDDEDDFVIEFVDIMDGDDGGEGRMPQVPIEDLLRAAGIDVKGPKKPAPAKGQSSLNEQSDEHEDGDQGRAKERPKNTRDEL